MGEVRTSFPPVKLIFGLLTVDEPSRKRCLERLAVEFGPIDHQSEIEPFTFTDYYCDEMGQTIYRQYLSCERLIHMADLPDIKLRTNQIEVEMARLDESGRRRRTVNIDPGYLTHSKLVLATTKDYSHRVYVANGIFAEVTLYYRKSKGFCPFPWTYPDYARPEVCEFFNNVRETYRRQIREQTAKAEAGRARSGGEQEQAR